MGTAASALSEAVLQGYIHQSSHKRRVEHLPCRHRQAGTGTPGTAHRGHETGTGHNKQLKEENALEWAGRLNNIRACAREIVNKEIIYA